MLTRTLFRWLLSIVLTCLGLITLNLLLTNTSAQAEPAATLINCSGSIQACIDTANDGDTILIAAERYTESLILNKPVSLTGENRDTTVIHAVEGQRVLTVTGATISHTVVISGLTFTGGEADYGGGVLITDTAQPLILFSKFVSNTAGVYGGAIYAHSNLTLRESQVVSNTATKSGGGVFAVQDLTATNSEFISNATTGTWPEYFPSGGGIYAQMKVFIANSRFIDNRSGSGGGLDSRGAQLILIDTDFIANAGGGIIAGSYDNSAGYTRIIRGQFAYHSSAPALDAYQNLEITGTQFMSNSNEEDYAAGVNVYAGAATIVNAHFENNQCLECYVGGLYFYGTHNEGDRPLILSNTVFISNSPGGVLVDRGSEVFVYGSRFERNTNQLYGSALWLYDTPLTMIDTDVISNTAVDGPGGVTAHPATILINSRFEGNISNGSYGGGIWTGELFLTNTDFINNSARAGGGALAGTAYLNGGRFEGNTAQVFGGGLAVANLVMSGTVFVSNTAQLGGGGGVLSFGIATLSGGRFENNRALGSQNSVFDGSGGGLAVASGPLLVTGTQFVNNSTNAIGGGLFYTDGTSSRIVNGLFASNVADVDGAALAIDAPGPHELLHLTIAGSNFITQSAIAVLTGTLFLTDTIIASHTIAISNTGGTVFEDYNLFFNNLTNTVGVTNGGHSSTGNPQFADPHHGDYHLRFGSAAINHGTDAGVYTDLDGNPRPIGPGFDSGAYEYSIAFYTYLPLVFK